MVDGYAKSCTNSIIPSEITKLCFDYYSEVLYWNIDLNEINDELTKTPEDDPDIVSEKFIDRNITIQYSLYHKIKHYYYPKAYSTLYTNVLLPANVVQVKVQSHIFCQNIDAEWRKSINYDRSWDWVTMKGTEPVWKREYFIMVKNLKSAFITAHSEILSIKYNDDTPDYYKQICIKKNSAFEWTMNKEMILKFRKCIPTQFYMSDTFDEVNNNWGLWIKPMGGDPDIEMDKQFVCIYLYLYDMPREIESIQVELDVIDDHTGKEYKNIFDYDAGSDSRQMSRFELFPSKDLFDIESLSLKVKLEIFDIS